MAEVGRAGDVIVLLKQGTEVAEDTETRLHRDCSRGRKVIVLLKPGTKVAEETERHLARGLMVGSPLPFDFLSVSVPPW